MVHVKIIKTEASPIKVAVKTPINYVNNADYEKLKNKPRINDVELIGNKTTADIGIGAMTNTEISKIVESVFKE